MFPQEERPISLGSLFLPFEIMTALSDPIPSGSNDPDPDIVRSWVVRGGHDVIHEKIAAKGWDGQT